MEKIVIYGKGGIGKSTVASNLSLVYALQGKKVLQIGCDPKHDSTLRILNGIKIKTVMDALHEDQDIELNKVLKTGVYEIDCLEAGGPPPGVGCAGRGITRMFEFFEEQSVLNKKNMTQLYLMFWVMLFAGDLPRH